MKNHMRQHIAQLPAYAVPTKRSPHKRLDFNERLDNISLLARYCTEQADLSLYPQYSALNTFLATYCSVSSQQVLACNGSDQAIDLLMRLFVEPGEEIIVPAPSFSMYRHWAAINQCRMIEPLYNNDGKEYPIANILASCNEKTRMIFVCSPNNPTGGLASISHIAQLAEQVPHAIIYADEAYYEYSCQTAIPLIAKYNNIIVSRTFSKAFGLAALRIGYLIAQPDYIEALQKIRGPFDVNALAANAACAALNDISTMRNYSQHIMYTVKPWLENELDNLNIDYLPSAANFLLLTNKKKQLPAEQLSNRGWQLRRFDLPLIGKCLRLTIGPLELMQEFIDDLQQILNGDLV